MKVFRNVIILTALAYAYIFWSQDGGEWTWRALVRFSAKVSLLCFVLSFTAGVWPRLKPGRISTLFMLQRDYWFLAFATVHASHLLALLILQQYDVSTFGARWPVGVVGGGLAYLCIAVVLYIMFVRNAKWPPLRYHASIMHWCFWWIWIVFGSSYLPRALEDLSYVPFALLLVIAAVLKIWTRPRGRRA